MILGGVLFVRSIQIPTRNRPKKLSRKKPSTMTQTRCSTSCGTSPMPVSSRKRCKYPTIDTISQPTPLYGQYTIYTYLNNTNYIHTQYGYLLKPRFSLRILPLGDTAKIIKIVKYYLRRQDPHYLLLSNIKTTTTTNNKKLSPHHHHHNRLYD